MMELVTCKTITVRFSEVDSMNVVWHGSYMLYFEDAREAFGKQWGLSYQSFYENGVFAPVVDMNFQFKNSMQYGTEAQIKIKYIPTKAAKIVFEYQIFDSKDHQIIYCTGKSTQIFTDLNHELLWHNPDFYIRWKEKWNI